MNGRKGLCEWCVFPASTEAQHPELLCQAHQAEHEGQTIDAMEHGDRIRYEEEREWAS